MADPASQHRNDLIYCSRRFLDRKVVIGISATDSDRVTDELTDGYATLTVDAQPRAGATKLYAHLHDRLGLYGSPTGAYAARQVHEALEKQQMVLVVRDAHLLSRAAADILASVLRDRQSRSVIVVSPDLDQALDRSPKLRSWCTCIISDAALAAVNSLSDAA